MDGDEKEMGEFAQSFSTVLTFERFINLLPLYLCAELLRRLLQSLREYFARRRSTRFYQILVYNLGPRFGTYAVPMVLAWLALVLQFSKNPVAMAWQNLTRPLLDGLGYENLHHKEGLDLGREYFFVVATVFVIYVAIQHFGWHLSTADKDSIALRSQHDLGPGMAKANFSFLENALAGLEFRTDDGVWTCPTFEDFIRDETEASARRSVTPVVLFPDLTGPYYRDSLDSVCIGLASGMIAVEDAEVAGREERGVMHMRGSIFYEYTDKAGDLRKANFTVISRKAPDPEDRSKDMYHYYFIIDNRPMMAIQKWYSDKSDSERDITDLHRQVESYKRSLIRLLETNAECRGRYRVLTVEGALSDAIRTIETVSVVPEQRG